MNSCATAEDAGLKNAFQEIVNSLRTILSGTHTSFVQKHMTWPMRLEAERFVVFLLKDERPLRRFY